MSQITVEITVEQVEALAAQIEADEAAEATKLMRLIKAEARIAANRNPGKFMRPAVSYVSSEGDGSYPPKAEYGDYTGPKSLKIRSAETEHVRTEPGFYHDWKYATAQPGLRIAADGTIYETTWTGTGSYGQFPAHPGDCNIEATIEVSRVSADSLGIDDLREIESTLRAVAFPASAGAE